MTDQVEQTPYSPSPTPWQDALHARGFTLEPWQQEMVESWQRDTTEPQPEHHIAPILNRNLVSVRCTLKLTSSLTLRDMEQLWRDARYMLQTAPAIRALVSSLMREYQPWFSTVSIETKLVYCY